MDTKEANKNYRQEILESLTMDDLKDICRVRGIKGYSKLRKAPLILKILADVTTMEDADNGH